VMFTI